MDANDTANAADERIDAGETVSDPPRYNLRPRRGQEEVAEEDTRQGLNVTDGAWSTNWRHRVDKRCRRQDQSVATRACERRQPWAIAGPPRGAPQLIGKGGRRAGRATLGLNSLALQVRQWALESYSTRLPVLMQARTSRLSERSVKESMRCYETTCLASHRQRIQCAARTEVKTER